MMRILIFVTLLAFCRGQGELGDLDSVFKHIFGNPNSQTTANPLPQASTLVWRISDNEVGDKSCKMEDGRIGECVRYYLCNANNSAITDGIDIIDIRIVPASDNEPNGQKLNVYFCGGSLIHPSIVLTAAHNVAGAKALVARAGEWDTQTTKEIYPHQDRDVARIEVHKYFNKVKAFYDIALLFLAQPMDLTPNVGVVCLPPPRERVPGGTSCFASGWGKDKFGKEGRYQFILKKVEVPVVERSTCQTQLQNTSLGHSFELHTSFMCAGGEAGKDTCEGDGGSPLSCPIEYETDRYMQSGIVTWGIGCGEVGIPGVYVDVSNLRNWIDDQVAGAGYDPMTYTI
ncbi:unnamed protein product [Parnassius apollo]|uniref:Phenoloxidase-activating factor 2 n=1 Tax=Parnassius apollo TaxID=110799 RepID=A0A8S3XQ67_PARAO|nr:unnamed protein product [Parnassius apollo]